jgi:4-hydroxymandelate oxidase
MVNVPVVVKGIISVDDATTAIERGAQGLVVSSHGGVVGGGSALPVDVLPAVADAVAGRVPVLVDGSFRMGSDVLKGLALGATAVMVARPPMWGLAAYGAEGVRTVLELLQTELARNMAASGRPTIDMIDRELVRFDSR